MQNFENISNILSSHTIELYKEVFREPHPIGSGLLIYFQGRHLLISVNHVLDMEDNKSKIENDPDEANIPQDDMESIMAKGHDTFFNINDNIKALVCTAHYNQETKEVVFNDDIEWCVCKLSEDIVKCFIENGKTFYKIDEELLLNIKQGSQIIVSGYPKYAQKEEQEIHRSFECELIEKFEIGKSGLFRAWFNQDEAFCLEKNEKIRVRPKKEGLEGMSGGGLWYKGIDKLIPLGIFIKQEEQYIEGYSLYEILKLYLQNIDEELN